VDHVTEKDIGWATDLLWGVAF